MTTVNYVCDWSTCVRVSTLPLCRSSEASSQPLPCPGISRELCRRSQSCLHHSSRRRASPHALSAQTTSQGTTWHTDWLPRTQTHTHIHARSNKVWLPNYLTAIPKVYKSRMSWEQVKENNTKEKWSSFLHRARVDVVSQQSRLSGRRNQKVLERESERERSLLPVSEEKSTVTTRQGITLPDSGDPV